jgi:hypothetical protein
VFTFAKWEICSILLLGLVYDIKVADSGKEKVMMAANVIGRCMLLFGMFRTLPVIGPLIIAVVSSFAPMQGMFAFMGLVFAMFSAAFMIFRDDDRSPFFVLLYLYEALFLTDRDAAESISGLDASHEQILDFSKEIYTGHGDAWLVHASAGLALVATSVFSLVLLNLTIGMYTNYSEKMQPLAELIFRHQRVKMSVRFMLTPAWWFQTRWSSLAKRHLKCVNTSLQETAASCLLPGLLVVLARLLRPSKARPCGPTTDRALRDPGELHEHCWSCGTCHRSGSLHRSLPRHSHVANQRIAFQGQLPVDQSSGGLRP